MDLEDKQRAAISSQSVSPLTSNSSSCPAEVKEARCEREGWLFDLQEEGAPIKNKHFLGKAKNKSKKEKQLSLASCGTGRR